MAISKPSQMNAGVKKEKKKERAAKCRIKKPGCVWRQKHRQMVNLLMIWRGGHGMNINIHKALLLYSDVFHDMFQSFFQVSVFCSLTEALEKTRDSLTLTKSSESDLNRRCWFCISLSVKQLTEAKRGRNRKQNFPLSCHSQDHSASSTLWQRLMGAFWLPTSQV